MPGALMTWEDDHREDGLWTLVDEALKALEEHVGTEELDASDSRVQRLRSVLSHLSAYRDNPDALITSTARKNVGRAVETITSQLPNIEALFKAPAGASVSKFEELAKAVRPWPQRGSISLAGLKQQVQQLQEALDHADESASQQVRELEELGATTSEEVKKQYQAHLEELQTDMADLQKSVSELSNEVGSIRNSVDMAESTIEEALKAHDATFEESEAQRAAAFDERIAEEVDVSQRERDSARTQAQEVLQEIQKKKEEAEALLGALAQRSTATDYGQWAEQQRNSAKWWSLTAVALFVLAAVAFIESTFHFFTLPATTVGADSLWGDALTRLGMTGVVLAGALYAARESGQHKKEQRKAKARELVLTTMDPFMANIDEDVKELIRSEAARAIFVLREEGDAKEDQSSMPDRLWEIIRSRYRPSDEE